MPRDKLLRVLLSERELAKLKEYAESNDMPVSEVIRDFIKGLP
jgi:hypothetical protein